MGPTPLTASGAGPRAVEVAERVQEVGKRLRAEIRQLHGTRKRLTWLAATYDE